jgi:adenine-specific DNA methylase
MPVESEAAESLHQKDMAAAASSIFLSCRKRESGNSAPALWRGFGGTGVAEKVREAVRQGLKDFSRLKLNAVDEMVAGYGRALHVLSENWPVLDGDAQVSPIRAMTEASAVVAHYQMERITEGRLRVKNLEPEAAMALTFYGIFGLASFPFDQALNLSRSLNIKLEERPAGYNLSGRMIGINGERPARGGRSQHRNPAEEGFYAPLLRNRAKLRLALPEERSRKRLDNPQTEWDILHGLIMAYREGDVPVAQDYLERHAAGKRGVILDLLSVWTKEMKRDDLRQEGEALLFGLR